MSQETSQWLNTNCLIGFTEKRGNAWHYKASDQGVESNHYEGAIPVEDVLRRLFAWHAVETPLYTFNPNAPFENAADKFTTIPDRKAIVADDNGDVLGIFKSGYQPHQYDEWLVENVSTLLNHDTGLGISSAGLLKNRGVAFVQIEVPETIDTPEGFKFRPFIGAATSFDGSLATTYKTGATAWVCDNTLAWGLREEGEVYRIKHTRNSGLRIADARSALGIIESIAEDFSAEVARLAAIDVTVAEWAALLDELVPVLDEATSRSQTIALNKREELEGLYKNDPRVSPWAGTGLGVVQAFNTWGQHFQTVKGALRPERNFSNMLSGSIAEDDENTLAALAKVQGRGFHTLVNA